MITELIAYFAQFVGQKQNVISYFATESEPLQEPQLTIYNQLFTTLNALPDAGLIPELKGFLFGMQDDVIVSYIKNIPMPFLMLLYPDIRSTAANATNITSTASVTLGVYENYSTKNKNIFQEAAIAQNTYNICIKIVDYMLSETSTLCPLARSVEPSSIIIMRDTLHGCIGHSIVMETTQSKL